MEYIIFRRIYGEKSVYGNYVGKLNLTVSFFGEVWNQNLARSSPELIYTVNVYLPAYNQRSNVNNNKKKDKNLSLVIVTRTRLNHDMTGEIGIKNEHFLYLMLY